MRVLEKKMIRAHQPGRAPVCGFATYCSNEDPIIQRRFGWEVSSDIHDDFEDAFSRDNGQSWSEVRPSLRHGKVEGGFLTYIESAVIFVPQREKLVIITDQKFEPALETGASLNASGRLHISVGDPLKPENTTTFVSDFGCEQGLYVSFCNPIEDSRRRIFVPFSANNATLMARFKTWFSRAHRFARCAARCVGNGFAHRRMARGRNTFVAFDRVCAV